VKQAEVRLAQVGGKLRPVVVVTRDEVLDVRANVTVAETASTVRGRVVEVPIDPDSGTDQASVVTCDGLHTVSQRGLTTGGRGTPSRLAAHEPVSGTSAPGGHNQSDNWPDVAPVDTGMNNAISSRHLDARSWASRCPGCGTRVAWPGRLPGATDGGTDACGPRPLRLRWRPLRGGRARGHRPQSAPRSARAVPRAADGGGAHQRCTAADGREARGCRID